MLKLKDGPAKGTYMVKRAPMAIYFQHGELWPKRTEVVAATPDAHSTEGRDG